MAEIRIESSAKLEEAIGLLRGYRKQFYDKGMEVNALQQTLCSHWQGDASTAFNERWRKEGENINTMLRAVDDYITALEAIKTNYEEMEARNKAIASGQ